MLPISTHCLQTDADDHKRMIYFFQMMYLSRFCKYLNEFCLKRRKCYIKKNSKEISEKAVTVSLPEWKQKRSF